MKFIYFILFICFCFVFFLGGGGQSICERRNEGFVKIHFFFGGGGGGSGGGGGHGRCEQRSEVFVNIKKKYFFFFGGGRGVWLEGVGLGGQDGCER